MVGVTLIIMVNASGSKIYNSNSGGINMNRLDNLNNENNGASILFLNTLNNSNNNGNGTLKYKFQARLQYLKWLQQIHQRYKILLWEI